MHVIGETVVERESAPRAAAATTATSSVSYTKVTSWSCIEVRLFMGSCRGHRGLRGRYSLIIMFSSSDDSDKLFSLIKVKIWSYIGWSS